MAVEFSEKLTPTVKVWMGERSNTKKSIDFCIGNDLHFIWLIIAISMCIVYPYSTKAFIITLIKE
jgi:hypothetical protein